MGEGGEGVTCCLMERGMVIPIGLIVDEKKSPTVCNRKISPFNYYFASVNLLEPPPFLFAHHP